MDKYLTGSTIRNLRERNGLTQAQLAECLNVSDKAVSKWETGAGLPDITLLEPIARTLRVSVTELLTGFSAENKNMGANILRSKFYVCPVCNNVIHATGEACVSCHGINLPPLQAEAPDAEHVLRVQMLDDELHVQVDHPMSKQHHLLFMAAGSADRMQFVRLYPEGPAEARFNPRGVQALYFCCNKDGLFSAKLRDTLGR